MSLMPHLQKQSFPEEVRCWLMAKTWEDPVLYYESSEQRDRVSKRIGGSCVLDTKDTEMTKNTSFTFKEATIYWKKHNKKATVIKRNAIVRYVRDVLEDNNSSQYLKKYFVCAGPISKHLSHINSLNLHSESNIIHFLQIRHRQVK